MQLAKTIINRFTATVIFTVCFIFITAAQENSPFSRYGLGDLTNTFQTLNNGMGGVAVAYNDLQSINFNNPASFASTRIVTYDLGVTIDSRILRSKAPVNKYNSANFSPAYIAVATPISSKHSFGLAFGFKPVTRISYNIIRNERLAGIDSVQSLFEGTGGMNEVFVGVGKKWKNLAIGLSTGYHFGKKQNNTKRGFINDTVVYYKANYNTSTTFGGVFLMGGFQYDILLSDSAKNRKITKPIKDFYYLKLGGTFSLGHQLNAEQTSFKETFDYDYSGGSYTIDSLNVGNTIKGKIKIPANFGFGFLFQKTSVDISGVYDRWAIGADLLLSNWKNYRFYDKKDATVNSWQFKIGGQWKPDAKNTKSYFSRVAYRAGLNVGKDYINADGKEMKTFSFSIGLGLPVRSTRFSYQYSTIHTALEIGKRGSAANNITENFFKLSVGFSLSDIWFIKRKYD
ncbi:MAG TPA: hypothetical protein PKZ66_01660 [Chitinophagaceae bacterium]|nr:hypothetical protein [Chitinophagaceae bacterium]